MTDELCAREGCGAPKAWHTLKSTLEELMSTRDARYEASPRWENPGGHNTIYCDLSWPEACVGQYCDCPAYLAPEPPKPERTAYVLPIAEPVMDIYRDHPDQCDGHAVATYITHNAIPLDEYLASHPQPAPRLCICGGEFEKHKNGRCSHVATFMHESGLVDSDRCFCREYRPVEASDD